ncbi:MAG: 4-hydroxy-3-methylbut-2-enyl diphosphate reductase [Chloroflexi bacterium]|nr:4-hydroxy-3-methylbut-2-enyl diphosphate reductase [Chloroflexota bacterium]
MALSVERAAGIGFCFGVKRAIDILEKVALQYGQVETLGAVVHNQQVLQRLADIGIRVANSVNDIKGNTVAIGAHGVSPRLEDEIRARYTDVINTTCPFVHRAQVAARRLARSGFSVVIYGDADHPEVRGILGWADGKGIATLDANFITTLEPLPRRLGVLSQTTQIPARFIEFVKKLVDSTLTKDSELRIIDTICHDIRERQRAALDLAKRVDLMLVIGSHSSANTKHLAELCATATKTYLVETAGEIQPLWLEGHHRVGVTSGASTADWTINEVLAKLTELGG